MGHTRALQNLSTLWKTLAGSLALASGRLSLVQLEDGIRRKYSEPIELENGRSQTDLGLTPGERMLLQRHLSPAAQVLDIGCASGRVAWALHREDYRVVGVDLNEAMIREAAAWPGQVGTRPDFRVMDARRLGFRDESFDAVLMIGSVICYLHGRAGRRDALREVRRLLRPGGTYFVVTPSRHYAWKFRAWFAAMQAAHAALRLVGRAAADWQPGDRVGPAWSGDTSRLVYWHMYAPSELAADLAASGLDVVESDTDGYMMTFVARKPPRESVEGAGASR